MGILSYSHDLGCDTALLILCNFLSWEPWIKVIREPSALIFKYFWDRIYIISLLRPTFLCVSALFSFKFMTFFGLLCITYIWIFKICIWIPGYRNTTCSLCVTFLVCICFLRARYLVLNYKFICSVLRKTLLLLSAFINCLLLLYLGLKLSGLSFSLLASVLSYRNSSYV